MNGLSEFAKTYYEQADIYQAFSEAEDREGVIWNELEPLFQDKIVLDLGCGNGRYLQKIHSVAKCSYGLEQSVSQIQKGMKNLPFICGNAAQLPFSDNSFDFVFSSWVWGTVLDLEKRKKIFQESLRVLKPGGSILLIENDAISEFEYLRGRFSNDKTQVYNDWILQHGFQIQKKMHIWISFPNIQIAQNVFQSIWSNHLIDLPKKDKISNHVLLFRYQK
jgi:ubiquinone/menaquinone biosynthesis C-methylase UbiE